jgi:hypothetical protein
VDDGLLVTLCVALVVTVVDFVVENVGVRVRDDVMLAVVEDVTDGVLEAENVGEYVALQVALEVDVVDTLSLGDCDGVAEYVALTVGVGLLDAVSETVDDSLIVGDGVFERDTLGELEGEGDGNGMMDDASNETFHTIPSSPCRPSPQQ